jgi:NAD(P)-dependent dehydrogenase (short-subunit alcohol dehydrogenase family)
MAEDVTTPKPGAGGVSLEGRTAFVTGASSGLGFGIARAIAGAGGRVVVAARRRDRLDELVSEIERKGGEALAVECDVGDEASITRAFDLATDRFGRVDTIVANAGINRDGSVMTMSVADFDAIISVNLRGVFLTAREGARRLIDHPAPDAPNGRVLLIGSIAGLRTLPGLTAYGVSKAGVVMLGRCLAREWARHHINVNTLCPGFFKTDLNEAWFETAAGQKQIQGFSRRRLMAMEDLLGAALYLLSDQARATTGASLAIDDAQETF